MRTMKALPRTALLTLSLLAACPGPTPPPMGNPDLSPPPAPGDLGATSCADDAGERAKGGVCVHQVSGQVVDAKGVALKALNVTLCAGLCFFGKTDDQGHFTISVEEFIRTDQYSLDLHGQPQWAAYYMALPPVDLSGNAIYPQPLPLLPMPTSGPDIARDESAQTLSAGGVTLSIPAGTDVLLSAEDAGDLALGGKLRPLRVTQLGQAPFLGSLQPADLYAFGPFEAVFSKPVQLTLANAAGLPAGTAVELLEQRGLLGNTPPGAAFLRVATGHVSADGKTITMDPGSGVRELTWLAVRKLQ